jgi:ribosome-associated heat shock protein Hsp15
VRRDEAEWQRLDLWLWCARVAKARSDCARLVEDGAVRLNRQPVVKAHARLRIGDVLTMALRGEVRVWRVMALAARRGPAPEARLLYEEVPESGGGAGPAADPCAKSSPAAYEGAEAWPRGGDASGDDQHGSQEIAAEPAGDLPQDRHQER